jgi:hypothetical protein
MKGEGTCEHCSKRFSYELYHAGFGEFASPIVTDVGLQPCSVVGTGVKTFDTHRETSLVKSSLTCCHVVAAVTFVQTPRHVVRTASRRSRPKSRLRTLKRTRRAPPSAGAGSIVGKVST